ncbi:hypothetical protein A8A01_03210 [Ewingella americana]|uniref:hypothetical protein n=1 Tax=Ewingella docleensis TaxID=3118588 RepID=UPI000C2FCEF5|nr:hypothetical protein A8A01_03210 [Ewingella americana]
MNCEKERFESHRAMVRDYATKNNSFSASDVERLLNISRTSAKNLVNRCINLGDIYRSGSGRGSSLWLNEDKFIKYGLEKEMQRQANRKRKPAFKVTDMDTLIFLSKKRPSGTNTIFEECKQNSAMLLPVLRTMAARRVA